MHRTDIRQGIWSKAADADVIELRKELPLQPLPSHFLFRSTEFTSKARRLVDAFGDNGFDYLGNDRLCGPLLASV